MAFEKQVEIPITGMTCASCVRNVERANVQFDPGQTSVPELNEQDGNAGTASRRAVSNYPLPG